MADCDGRTYHMIHRSGWRDPLGEPDWENIFYEAHPLPEVALLAILWESLSDGGAMPRPARILSLPDLAMAAKRCRGLSGRRAVRDAHIRFAAEAAQVIPGAE